MASEAGSEVVLFTRKSTGRIFNPKDPIGSLQSHRNLDSASELKTEDESINNVEETQIPSSPTYVIEFNEDNKLKLVPRVTPTIEIEKDHKLEEKYSKYHFEINFLTLTFCPIYFFILSKRSFV